MAVVSAPTLAPGVRATLHRAVFRPVWLALALCTVPFLLDLSVPTWLRYAPFLASALVLGLPHGAVDHLALAWTSDLDRPLAAVSLLYFLAGGAYLACWIVAPAPAFAFFIMLTWFHWGQGDLYALRALADHTHLRTRAQRTLAVAIRGGLPMCVPLVAFPEVYAFVARETIALFDPGGAAALAVAFHPDVRFALGGAFATLTVAALGLGFVRSEGPQQRASWRFDAVETLLLWGYFLVVPPILAVGLYFCLWHSLRHVVRLIALDPGGASALRDGSLRPGLARFARHAAPLTAGALVVLYGLSLLAPADDPRSLLGLYLVLLAVLTLPHVLVVAWMDHEQRVW